MADTEQKQDKRLETIIALLEGSPTRKEFDDSVEQLAKFVLDLKQATNQAVSEIERTYKALLEKVGNDNSSSLEQLKSQVNELFVSGKLKEIENYLNNRVDEKLATVTNGKDGARGDRGEPGKSIKGDSGSPDTPEEVRDKLESLRGDDRLDVSAIKGLDKKLKKIENKSGYAGGGFTGKDIIKQYDLSSQLDGVLKTFNIPANWTILDVRSSSFPFAFRYGIDYTFTPQTITFTDEITASGTLATGQTLYIIYVSG